MKTNTRKIPDYKIKIVKELVSLLKKNRTIVVSSISEIPTSQIQKIQKNLRKETVFKIPKKNLIFLALDSEKEKFQELKKQIKGNVALLFSNVEGFDLAKQLEDNKISSKAKAGQIAPEDIEVPAGPTDLVPGHAISELGALGIKIKIEKGKINIQEPKIVAKKGEKISEGTANLLGKLDIKPFLTGLKPGAVFDTKENKLYLNIDINPEKTLEKLRKAVSEARGLSFNITYYTKENITQILGKAYQNAKVLKGLNNIK